MTLPSEYQQLKEYQEFVEKSAHVRRAKPWMEQVAYAGLGLAGETGEVVEHVKKLYRQGKGKPKVDAKLLVKIKKELGDDFWYLTRLTNLFGFTVEEVLETNVRKLKARQARKK